jgi:hypothetical protein
MLDLSWLFAEERYELPGPFVLGKERNDDLP